MLRLAHAVFVAALPGCAHRAAALHPPRAIAPASAPAPTAQVEVEPAPTADPMADALAASLRAWVAEAAGRAGCSLVLEAFTPAVAVSTERGVYATRATVRDEASGAVLQHVVWARAPLFPSQPWQPRTDPVRSIAQHFALRGGVEVWLAAHPDLRALQRATRGDASEVLALSDARGTTLCAWECPPHGPVLDACWREASPVAPFPPDALEYRWGVRFELRARYALAAPAEGVRVRIFEAGPLRRGRVRPPGGTVLDEALVPRSARPDLGPLASLDATTTRDATGVTLLLATAIERRRCVRSDDAPWACGPIEAAPSASP